MSKELIKNYKETDEYKFLIEDCRAIFITQLTTSRTELIVGYGLLGERISQDSLYKKYGKGNQGFLRDIATDSALGYSTICRAVQFYEKYKIVSHKCEGWNKLPEGTNISWHKIVAKYLPEPKQERIPLPKGKYDVFLIDPPWTYRNTGVEGAVENKYPSMTIEELCKMPIEDLATQNAVLFLWTTNPILEECFEVIRDWGFEYKTNFCWIKRNKKTGIGFYVRGVHELLLICVRGQMLPKYTPLSVIEEDAKGHSRKPEIYGLIEKMYPNGKYAEFFARNNKKRNGWTYWGDQANT